MFRITKEFHFSASHQLTGLPEDHQCARLHGHNYIVEVELSASDLNEHGFVRDYHELAPFKRYIDDCFDHRHLNDVLGHDQSTAETLARHFLNGATRAGRKYPPCGSAKRPRHGPSTDRDADTDRGNFRSHDTGRRCTHRRADGIRANRRLRLSLRMVRQPACRREPFSS